MSNLVLFSINAKYWTPYHILNHFDGTTLSSTSGYTDVLKLTRKDNGHNKNAAQINPNITQLTFQVIRQ